MWFLANSGIGIKISAAQNYVLMFINFSQHLSWDLCTVKTMQLLTNMVKCGQTDVSCEATQALSAKYICTCICAHTHARMCVCTYTHSHIHAHDQTSIWGKAFSKVTGILRIELPSGVILESPRTVVFWKVKVRWSTSSYAIIIINVLHSNNCLIHQTDNNKHNMQSYWLWGFFFYFFIFFIFRQNSCFLKFWNAINSLLSIQLHSMELP